MRYWHQYTREIWDLSRQEGGWCVHRCVFLQGADALTMARDWDLPSHGAVDLLRQAAQRGAGDEWKATCLCRCTPTLPEGNPLRGIDAPTTARTVGLPPRRGKYFLSKRKKVPKKASGTATTGKSPLLPILTAGLAMSRAMELDSFQQLLERARARLFPPSKWAGLFPSLPIAALFPRSRRGANSNGGAWDVLVLLGWFCGTEKQA